MNIIQNKGYIFTNSCQTGIDGCFEKNCNRVKWLNTFFFLVFRLTFPKRHNTTLSGKELNELNALNMMLTRSSNTDEWACVLQERKRNFNPVNMPGKYVFQQKGNFNDDERKQCTGS